MFVVCLFFMVTCTVAFKTSNIDGGIFKTKSIFGKQFSLLSTGDDAQLVQGLFVAESKFAKERSIFDIPDCAFIVCIAEVLPIFGRSDIELARIKGWKCIVPSGQFVVGDKAVYVAAGCRIEGSKPTKTIALAGVVSFGALLPMSCLLDKGFTDLSKYQENDSVATELGATKHVHRDERNQYKKGSRKEFPEYVPKTSATRLQHDPDLFFAAIQDKDIVVTTKQDGCSSTYIFNKGEFVMCGRNFIWHANDVKEQPAYFHIADKFDLKRGMTKLNRNIAIQGEIVGPKINGNRQALKETLFYVFDVFDIDAQQYLGYEAMVEVCAALGLPVVPLVYRGPAKEAVSAFSVDQFMHLAEAQYYSGGSSGDSSDALPAEGIVVKTDDPQWRQQRAVFKVISDKYCKLHNVY